MRLNVFFPDQWIISWGLDVSDDFTNADVTKQFGGNEIVSAVHKVPAGAIRLTVDEIDDTYLEKLIHQRLQSLEPAILSHVRTMGDVFSGHSEYDLHLVVRTKDDRMLNVYRFDTEDAYQVVVKYDPFQMDMTKVLPDEVGQKQARILLVPYDTPYESGTPDEFGLNLEKLKSVTPLTPVDECFKWGLQPYMLHVVLIVTAPSKPTLKRKASDDLSVEEAFNLLIREIFMMAPSSLAESDNFRKITGKGHIVDFNRPFNPETIPIALCCEGFDLFRRVYKKSPSGDAYGAAMNIVRGGCVWYEKERSRREAVGAQLENFLGQNFDAGSVPYPCTSSLPKPPRDPVTDGNLDVTIMPAAIRGCKKDHDHAVAQATAYYGLFLAHALSIHDYNTRFPCILLIDTGTLIGFYGALWDGQQIRVRPLTPVYELTTDRMDSTRDELASAMDAFKAAVKIIQEQYRSLQARSASAGAKEDRRYPYRTSFKSDGQTISFNYVRQLYPTKLIFKVEAEPDSRMYIVKYTRRYSEEAHKCLASAGFAPKLHQCLPMAGEWYMVVMDMSDYTLLHQTPLDKEREVEVQAKVREAIKVLHQEGFVHGDVRDTNILVNCNSGSTKAHIVDFDWAGRIGQVCYPSDINTSSVKRPVGVKGNALITTEHDEQMASDLFYNDTAMVL